MNFTLHLRAPHVTVCWLETAGAKNPPCVTWLRSRRWRRTFNMRHKVLKVQSLWFTMSLTIEQGFYDLLSGLTGIYFTIFRNSWFISINCEKMWWIRLQISIIGQPYDVTHMYFTLNIQGLEVQLFLRDDWLTIYSAACSVWSSATVEISGDSLQYIPADTGLFFFFFFC